ncbi:MAG: excinuclease ABC subunit C [Thermoflexus sp.]|uniref:excinuclease ABC subunit UvrC n=1 Tax=Thermoflexus sp. TaxID=1969742 RepID=UPI0033339DCC
MAQTAIRPGGARPAALEEKLRALPARPGVYLFKNAHGEVLYVGKSASLRQRVRSYFQGGADLPPRTRRMVQEVADLDFIVTDSELEALILEANLIKRHRPKYNVRLKDDKRYPYIKITVQDPYPKVTITRRIENDGARYFGPYTSVHAVHQMLDELRRIFPYLTCDRTITGRDRRACLYYDLGRCLGPCIGAVGQAEYRAMIEGLVRFLEGHTEEVVRDLEAKMWAAAEALQFERAAQIRDRLQAIRQVMERQRVVSTVRADRDVIAIARAGGEACVEVFFIRQGKLIGREHFILEGLEDADLREALAGFLKQFYQAAADVPPEILLPEQVEEAAVIEQWLRQRRGDAVTLIVPREGEAAELVRLAAENAAETLHALRARWQADRHRQEAALRELAEALGLPAPPARIEGFDISNTMGTAVVGSMVVFIHGVPLKAHYRRFVVRSVQGRPDDYASLREVLTRRFRRWQEAQEGRRLPGQKPDESFATLPDLLLVDGGKGQLGVALEVLEAEGLQDRVPVAALAKEREALFLPGRAEELVLPHHAPARFLLQRVRDEAHRFALSHHRARRERRSLASVLEEIPGVGPARRRRLLERFGSLEGIRQASVEDLVAAGLPRAIAERVKAALG